VPPGDDPIGVIDDHLVVDIGQDVIAPDRPDEVNARQGAAQPGINLGVDLLDRTNPAAIDGDAVRSPAVDGCLQARMRLLIGLLGC